MLVPEKRGQICEHYSIWNKNYYFFSVEHYHIEYSWQNQKLLIWNFFSSFIHFTLLRSLMFCFELGNGMVRNETKWIKKNVILKFCNHPGDITTSMLFVASNLVCAYYSLQQSHGKYNLCAFTFSYRTLWAPRQSLFRGRAERTEKNLKTSVLKCGSNRQI